MLTPNERSGLHDILQDIDDHDVFSILETLTKRMFTTQNRQVAIEKILLCTENPSAVLRQQKVTKKVLFKYLVKRIVVQADWDKVEMVRKCLKFWGSTEPCKDSDYVETVNENQCHEVGTQQMGFEFSEWFFKLLNTLDGFGPEHLWPNCKLSAELFKMQDCEKILLFCAVDVAAFFAKLIRVDKYYFHAEESKDSVKIEVDRGVIKVFNHGVLHQHSNRVGLFKVAFGLKENPIRPATYKIWLIKMEIQVNTAVQRGLSVNNDRSICLVQ